MFEHDGSVVRESTRLTLGRRTRRAEAFLSRRISVCPLAQLALFPQFVIQPSRLLAIGRPRALAVLVDAQMLLEVVESVFEHFAAALRRTGIHLRRAANAVGTARVCQSSR